MRSIIKSSQTSLTIAPPRKIVASQNIAAFPKTLTVTNLLLSLLLVVSLGSFSSVSFAETLTIDSAINKAGRQRMLTQRIVKSYLLIGQDVATETAQEQLDASIALFEEQLEELETYAPNQSINDALQAVRQQWNQFRRSAIAKPTKSDALAMIQEGEKTLANCEKVVQRLEAYSGNQKGKLINISGRQRMLSQRIGMFYAAKSWNLDSEVLNQPFKQAMDEYDQALRVLTASKLNTSEINTALDKVISQWEFSRSGFEQMENGRYVPFIIQVTTESMLKKMNKITGMYEQVMEKGVS